MCDACAVFSVFYLDDSREDAEQRLLRGRPLRPRGVRRSDVHHTLVRAVQSLLDLDAGARVQPKLLDDVATLQSRVAEGMYYENPNP